MEKFTPPKTAQNNARKVLEWRKKHGRDVKGMTNVGWIRANQLASGKPISENIVKRMAQFNRHRKNATIDPKFENEPWKDRGYVAWLGWGGDAGIDWAISKTKSKSDAPNYRFMGLTSDFKCNNCKFLVNGICEKFDFKANGQYTCDDWRPNVKKTKEVSSTPTTTYAHGPTGLFSQPGLGGAPKNKKLWEKSVKLFGKNAKRYYEKMGGEWEESTKPDKSPGKSIKNPKVYEALIKAGYSKQRAAMISNSMVKEKSFSLIVFKDKNNQYRWLSISSNAYRDRDGEIVSRKALMDDVRRADKDKNYGTLRFWHTPIVLGECDFNMIRGKTLIESGTFKNDFIAEKVAKKSQDYQISIGFRHPPNEPDSDGVFHNIRRFERSLVPAGKASNPFTKLTTVKETEKMNVDPRKVQSLKSLLEDDAVVDALFADAEQSEKQADTMGIAFKDHQSLDDLGDSLIEYGMALKEFYQQFEESNQKEIQEKAKEDKPDYEAMIEKKMAGYTQKMDDMAMKMDKMASYFQKMMEPKKEKESPPAPYRPTRNEDSVVSPSNVFNETTQKEQGSNPYEAFLSWMSPNGAQTDSFDAPKVQ